jgi:VWFA-related protein
MMKKLLPILSVVIAFSANLLGQTSGPTPSPTPPTDNDVVKISTNLIQVDVTVVDANGKVINDIKPEEVEIYENGQKQKITNFSFISSVKTTFSKPVKTDKTAIPAPPVTLRREQIRRTIALVVDDLTLSFESAYQTRRALKKYVDEQMQDGDLAAIIRTGAGIGALQQFTSDKRMLNAAIQRVKWNPHGTGGISAFAPVEPTPKESLRAAGDTTITDEAIKAERDRLNAMDDYRNSGFVVGTFGALQYVISGMSELPGRKSIILFSDGFRLMERDEFGTKGTGAVLDGLSKLTDAASRASVVIYAIDPRGLQTTAMTAEDHMAHETPAAAAAVSAQRGADLRDTQDGLIYLAEQTGGFAVVNNNDLNAGVRRALNDQSYYLVGYEPDSDTFDPGSLRFNTLVVKVLRKGATARYRRGFLNVAERAKPVGSANRTISGTPLFQLQRALVSPFAVNGINLKLNALFGNDDKGGSFVRSLLHVDAGDLKFTDEANGTKKAVFDVLAMSFGDNGQVVDKISKTYTLRVKPDGFKAISAAGFVYHFSFPVKKAGAYQYRVAIRDVQGGKLGSASQFIEVPDLKKRGLTVSSIALESMTQDQYVRSSQAEPEKVGSDPMADTALRRTRVGAVLRYGFEIYNAKLTPAKQPQLQVRIRIFNEGKLILDGTQKPVELARQTDMQHVKAAGAISIGSQMPPGDYVLQIIVTDGLATAKKQVATQFVQFEVVE